jgi:hypothetical protein
MQSAYGGFSRLSGTRARGVRALLVLWLAAALLFVFANPCCRIGTAYADEASQAVSHGPPVHASCAEWLDTSNHALPAVAATTAVAEPPAAVPATRIALALLVARQTPPSGFHSPPIPSRPLYLRLARLRD